MTEEVTSELFSTKADELFEPLSHDRYCFLLDSGCDYLKLGRYSILGSEPKTIIRSRKGMLETESDGIVGQSHGDPLKKLEDIINAGKSDYDGPLPFTGGLVGYIGYGLSPLTVGVKIKDDEKANIPDMEFGLYEDAVVCDNLEGRVWLVSCCKSEEKCRSKLCELRLRLTRKSVASSGGNLGRVTSLESDYAKEKYIEAVKKVKDYIREGDIYQANISQRYSGAIDCDGWSLYKRLRKMNPAPYAAYLRFGDTEILSSSPERFLRVHERNIETRPIKGTRPRGANKPEDERLASELLASVKDKAEHLMIVDLERNDLGKICEYGSVTVPEFEALESYETVHHMVSTVHGTLRPEVGMVDCIRACFPGGSITGAPKVRSMEIIDEIEPKGRGLYTGSIGYISLNGRVDLNIVIRTMVYTRGRVFFNVGGGVVADSDPQVEYDETIDKARALFQSLGVEGYGTMKTCVNGNVIDEDKAILSPLDYGILYGYGIFETMRADKGVVSKLKRHLLRLRRAASEIHIPLQWSDDEMAAMIDATLRANGLSDAYVRVTVTRGKGEPRLNIPEDTKPTLTVLVRSLPEPVLSATAAVSTRYRVYSKDIRSRIKSTNYLNNALAKREAEELKVDEMILLNEDGLITECSTANIFLVKDGRIITPSTESGALSGITREAVIEIAREMGLPVEERDVAPDEIAHATEVFKTNSISGILPLIKVDGKPVGDGTPGKITLELMREYAK